MNRRIMMSSIGLGTAGLTLSNLARAQQDKGSTGSSSGHSSHTRIAPMTECASACAEAAKHCLNELRQSSGDRNLHAIVFECASATEDFCTLAARLEACENPLAAIGHAAAAEACKACAEACEREGKSSEVLVRCVEMCRRCEQHCRTLASSSSHRAGSTTTETRNTVDASKIETPRRP